MGKMKDLYHEWNSGRAGISVQESVAMMAEDEAKYDGGYLGKIYKRHLKEMAEADYLTHDGTDCGRKMYSAIDDLLLRRQLSYVDVTVDPELSALMTDSHMDVLDYGCGIGQDGIELCLARKALGKTARLTLCDFPGSRTDFSLWAAQKLGVETKFCPAPSKIFPPCDIVVAMDVMEHIHKPLEALMALHVALRPGGIVWGNFYLFKRDVLHVSPNLRPVVSKLRRWGYAEEKKCQIFVKPGMGQR